MQIKLKTRVRRGDTLIEVMFALAVFSLVAVLSIAMMNAGVASSERALEVVTARNELNAQAEALRFIHSSYVAELTLPTCDSLTPEQKTRGEKCQQFRSLWQTITNNAVAPYDADDPYAPDHLSIQFPVDSCTAIYENNAALLADNHAFVLNTRQISFRDGVLTGNDIYVSALNSSTRSLFKEPALSARLVFIKSGTTYNEDSGDSSVDVLSSDPLTYRKLGRAEGIWVIAVKASDGAGHPFYDFYIETCWYAAGAKAPTSLDAVIRLNDPEGM